MIRTSSLHYFSGAEIQCIVSIASATDNSRIGQGIEHEKEKEKRNPSPQSESPRPSFRHNASIHVANQPRHECPKREDSENVEEHSPCARILLDVAEGGPYKDEREAKSYVLVCPQECHAPLQGVS